MSFLRYLENSNPAAESGSGRETEDERGIGLGLYLGWWIEEVTGQVTNSRGIKRKQIARLKDSETKNGQAGGAAWPDCLKESPKLDPANIIRWRRAFVYILP